MTEPRGPSPAGIVATLGVFAAAMLCCAGPALIASGALAGAGGVLRSPWLIAAGSVLLVWVIVSTVARLARRRAGNSADECCPPRNNDAISSEHSAPRPDHAPRSGRTHDSSER